MYSNDTYSVMNTSSAEHSMYNEHHDHGIQGPRSGTGQPFPDGSMIVKFQWKQKKSVEAPFVVDVPDVFTQAFGMEKDSKIFPKSGGRGYAIFNYEAASDQFTADPKSLSDCGHGRHKVVKAKDYIFHTYEKR
jgi:hypothetical protein